MPNARARAHWYGHMRRPDTNEEAGRREVRVRNARSSPESIPEVLVGTPG